jgi:probable rRNA maturation factor
MIYLENDHNYSINCKKLESILQTLSKKDVELLIINNDEIKDINKKQRNINKSTDVLSFPLEDCGYTPLGSIVINHEKAMEVSKKLKHSVEDEITLLFIHGLLHLLRFDHEIDNGEMRAKEEELIKKFRLPLSLIVRSSKWNI